MSSPKPNEPQSVSSNDDLGAALHSRSVVLEYDEEYRWLIVTDRIGPHEYGASAIVADHVIPWFGRLLVEVAHGRDAAEAEA